MPTLPFTEFIFLQSYRDSFVKSELGRIHSQLPLKKLAAECTNRSHKGKRDKKPLFSGEGEIAMMFLKSYTGLEPGCLRTARKDIRNLRATVMEGSFGNQNQHYSVGRIKARNVLSEKLLLFLGIHTANAAILSAREMAQNVKKAA